MAQPRSLRSTKPHVIDCSDPTLERLMAVTCRRDHNHGCVWFAWIDEIRCTFASAGGLCGRVGLPHCLLDFVDPVWTLEDFPRLGTIGSADNTVALHKVDQVGSSAIPDP